YQFPSRPCIFTLILPDALPIWTLARNLANLRHVLAPKRARATTSTITSTEGRVLYQDRKIGSSSARKIRLSCTSHARAGRASRRSEEQRLNSSHVKSSYAVSGL